MDNLNVKRMYLIDPYLETGLQGSNVAMMLAKRMLYYYRNKIRFVKEKSENAIDLIPKGIDFLYIDGYHAKRQVAKELRMFYPKMNPGGVMAGHDYLGEHIELTEAVIEFKQKYNLKLYGGSYDWWFIV